MRLEVFKQIVESRQRKQTETLINKAKEYASEGDRLHNFVRAAKINRVPQSEALWGMATKHLVCIIDWIDRKYVPTPAEVDEKLGDLYNYLVLLEAVYVDMRIEMNLEYVKEVMVESTPQTATTTECTCQLCTNMKEAGKKPDDKDYY